MTSANYDVGVVLYCIEGQVILDREIYVRHMATATLRGLLGHMLKESEPGAVGAWFKPGNNGDCPAAFCMQPVLRTTVESEYIPFRIITWDRPEAAPGQIIRALDLCQLV